MQPDKILKNPHKPDETYDGQTITVTLERQGKILLCIVPTYIPENRFPQIVQMIAPLITAEQLPLFHPATQRYAAKLYISPRTPIQDDTPNWAAENGIPTPAGTHLDWWNHLTQEDALQATSKMLSYTDPTGQTLCGRLVEKGWHTLIPTQSLQDFLKTPAGEFIAMLHPVITGNKPPQGASGIAILHKPGICYKFSRGCFEAPENLSKIILKGCHALKNQLIPTLTVEEMTDLLAKLTTRRKAPKKPTHSWVIPPWWNNSQFETLQQLLEWDSKLEFHEKNGQLLQQYLTAEILRAYMQLHSTKNWIRPTLALAAFRDHPTGLTPYQFESVFNICNNESTYTIKNKMLRKEEEKQAMHVLLDNQLQKYGSVGITAWVGLVNLFSPAEFPKMLTNKLHLPHAIEVMLQEINREPEKIYQTGQTMAQKHNENACRKISNPNHPVLTALLTTKSLDIPQDILKYITKKNAILI